MLPPPPRSTLFPYTTLFRSRGVKNFETLGPSLLRLLEAIVNRRRCKLEYASPGRARPRRFPYDPYRLLAVHGGLYCVGKDRKSTRLNSSHVEISYAVFCLKK